MALANPAALRTLQQAAAREVDECVVGALIVDPAGRVFAQRRAANRRLFPGCWDIAGGHVDAGESLLEALAREVREETGWVVRAAELLHVFDWSATVDGRVVRKREFDFLVDVAGDLGAPRIEREKHPEFRWIGRDEVGVLMENRRPDDTVIRDLVVRALEHRRGRSAPA